MLVGVMYPTSLPKEGDWICMAETIEGPDKKCDAMDHDPDVEIAKIKAIRFCKSSDGCAATKCRIVRCMQSTSRQKQ